MKFDQIGNDTGPGSHSNSPMGSLCQRVSRVVPFFVASEWGFAAKLYSRISESSVEANISLFCAKTRVKPLKTKTLLKVELNGAFKPGCKNPLINPGFWFTSNESVLEEPSPRPNCRMDFR